MTTQNERNATQPASMDSLAEKRGMPLSMEQTTAEILHGIIEATSPDVAFFSFCDGQRLILKDVAPPLARPRILKDPEHFLGQCLCDLAVKRSRPLYFMDVRTDERFACNECKEAGFTSFAALPLKSRDTIIGVIGLAANAPRDFAVQAGFLETLAHFAALAMANALFCDAAQQKLAQQQQAQAAQQRLTEILENTSDLVSMATPDTRQAYLNRAGRRLAGWGIDETLDERMIADLHPAWALAKIEKEGLPTALADGIWQGDVAILNQEGREIPVSQVILCHRGPDGTVDHFSTIMRDLRTRKRVEEQLRQSEERFRLTLATSPDAINISRLEDGVFVDINDRFTQLMGFTRDDVIGKSSLSINMWHDAADRQKLVHRLKEKGVCNDLEVRFRLKDGSVGTGLVSARIIELQGVAHIISITRDITRVKKAEAERENLQAQLYQAQKMEAVGQLAGGVAHDFNNMLSVVIGHTEMALLNPNLSQDLQSRLNTIHQTSLRSADLVRQLLAFARKQTANPKVLNINKTIDGMLGMLRRLIGEDIDLAWIPCRNPGTMRIDPSQMDQILANLVVNARDAIAGVGKITIETAAVVIDEAYCTNHVYAKPGTYVLLTVSDNGCGMDPETLAQIFEPFFTTKIVGHGTGLGLATVYGIIKQNKGFINVYSEPGQGTTFRIYLPAADAVPADDSTGIKSDASLEGSETLLVVEDDRDMLQLTRSILETLGYRVLTAMTPQDAIALATRHGHFIDLLISDVVMPEMNGRQLAQRLCEIAPDLKCLFMSGYTANVIAQSGVLDPGVHFIQKPFSVNDLAVKVKEVLRSGIETRPKMPRLFDRNQDITRRASIMSCL
jgi:PAS domain S-box-containing protein